MGRISLVFTIVESKACQLVLKMWLGRSTDALDVEVAYSVAISRKLC